MYHSYIHEKEQYESVWYAYNKDMYFTGQLKKNHRVIPHERDLIAEKDSVASNMKLTAKIYLGIRVFKEKKQLKNRAAKIELLAIEDCTPSHR